MITATAELTAVKLFPIRRRSIVPDQLKSLASYTHSAERKNVVMFAPAYFGTFFSHVIFPGGLLERRRRPDLKHAI